ncbi:MAG: hypothetical protein H6686_00750 [Fibrobacteria bacterium]|nr:hypothetical protein [Fibrobacteria bacterium]
MDRFKGIHSGSPLAFWLLLLLLVLPGSGISQPLSLMTSESSRSGEDPQLRRQLDELREKYQKDRQELVRRSSQLPPEERLRLHRELLEKHRAALAQLEKEADSRRSGARKKWEERREQRVERLQEVKKDGSARQRRKEGLEKR